MNLEIYKQRITDIYPDLSIDTLALDQEGLMNDVVIVNGELIFRFPKHEYSLKRLKEEADLLRILKKYLTLDIPEPIYEAPDVMIYRMIKGVPLRRDMLLKLDEDSIQRIADQMALFHKELHAISAGELSNFTDPKSDAVVKYEGWVKIYDRIKEKVFPLLQGYTREWAREHFETFLGDRNNFEYEYKFIDGDAAPYHFIFDKERKVLTGKIDFGIAGLGDPAIDIGVVISMYGESVLERFYKVYPEARSYLKRARFYAEAIQLRWVLIGIERGDPTWFTVHIGCARDVGYR